MAFNSPEYVVDAAVAPKWNQAEIGRDCSGALLRSSHHRATTIPLWSETSESVAIVSPGHRGRDDDGWGKHISRVRRPQR